MPTSMIDEVLPWRHELYWKLPRFSVCNDWVVIDKLPLNLRNDIAFAMVGDKFRGLIELAKKNYTRLDLTRVLMKVKGFDVGFFPKNLIFPCWDSSIMVRVDRWRGAIPTPATRVVCETQTVEQRIVKLCVEGDTQNEEGGEGEREIDSLAVEHINYRDDPSSSTSEDTSVANHVDEDRGMKRNWIEANGDMEGLQLSREEMISMNHLNLPAIVDEVEGEVVISLFETIHEEGKSLSSFNILGNFEQNMEGGEVESNKIVPQDHISMIRLNQTTNTWIYLPLTSISVIKQRLDQYGICIREGEVMLSDPAQLSGKENALVKERQILESKVFYKKPDMRGFVGYQ
ncbi:hypothetical protein Sjap_000512 [Stephania japonica]|uniref:DUF4283 domain-containing protein n=1 Tax=Stephania japonica TaxID=461633 RepID=A0AAP0KKJ9_9MAGN